MTPWDNEWEPTLELIFYLAEGNGAPKPFDYHPEMEVMFNAQRNELLRQETFFVAQEKQSF